MHQPHNQDCYCNIPGTGVINVLFLVTVTSSQADELKLTAASVHVPLLLTASFW